MGSDTSVEPALSTTVAMYHDDWDYNMGRLTPTDEDRSWVRPLKTFFGKGVENDDTDIGSRGVERFIADVNSIQIFLDTAARNAEELQQQLEAQAEAEPQRLEEPETEDETDNNTASGRPAQHNTEAETPFGDLYTAD